MLCAGESDSEEQAISSDSEEQKRWRPATTSGRCAVCKRAKKGRCGTETAPAKCEKRAENARRPAGDRERGAGQHAHPGSAPSKHSLKRKNSWDLDDMQVICAPKAPSSCITRKMQESCGIGWEIAALHVTCLSTTSCLRSLSAESVVSPIEQGRAVKSHAFCCCMRDPPSV